MTNTVWYPHAIYLPGGVSITQLSDVVPAHNYQDLTEFAASEPAPMFTGTHQASPDNRFSSTQIKTLLDQFIAGEYNVAKDYLSGTVQVEFKAGKLAGVREGNAEEAHIRANCEENTGLFWESFRVRQGGLVEMRCRLVSVLNPETEADPMVFTSAVTLNATAGVNALFTLGKQVINGTDLSGVEEIEWNNNLTYEERSSDGDEFLTYIGVRNCAPVCRIVTTDLTVMETFTERGTALQTYNCFLRKKLKSKINVADTTAEHIRLQATAGTVKAREINGSPATAVVEVAMAAPSAGSPPFSVNSAIAIVEPPSND